MASRIASWLRSLQVMNRLYLAALMTSLVVLRACRSILSCFWSLQVTDYLYSLAFVIAIAGIVSILVGVDPSYFIYIVIPAVYIVCAIGFGFWIGPWIQRIWRSPRGKLLLTSSSAGIWILALIQTRMFAAAVLGLPPQDFEVTVRVWTLLFFLSSWIGIVAVLASVVSVVFFLIVVPLQLISFILPIFLKWKWAIGKYAFLSVGHALGAVMVFAIVVMGIKHFGAVLSSLEPAIRLTAYYADYHMVSRYPGVDVTKKLRLHTNGIVSYAEKHGWDVIISVEKIKPSQL